MLLSAGLILINSFMFQDLQTWAYAAYTPTSDETNEGMNDTGVCLTRPGEHPAALKMMAIVTLGDGRIVELYGPPSLVVWLPQGRELPLARGDEELTEILGLTERVGNAIDVILCGAFVYIFFLLKHFLFLIPMHFFSIFLFFV